MRDVMNKLIVFCRRHPMWVLLAASFAMLAAVLIFKGITRTLDTPSYIEAWDVSLSHGHVSNGRTPVYPILFGIGKMLFGDAHCEIFVVIVQIIVFYASALIFSKMIFALVPNRRAAWLTVSILFLFYPIINYLSILGTEPLSFSFTALFVYSVWRFLQQPSWKYGIAVAMLIVLEIMLRPAMMILVVVIVLLAVAGMFSRQYRRATLMLLLTLIPIGVIYPIYTAKVEELTGVHTLSTVGTINNYFIARQYDDIFPEYLEGNTAALDLMKRYQKTADLTNEECIARQYDEIVEAITTGILTYKQMDDYARQVRDNHPGKWLQYMFKRIWLSLHSNGPVKTWCNYLIVLFYTLAFLAVWIRRHTFSLINFLTLMMGGGSLLSVWLFAQLEFGRLMLPTSAVLILMGGQLLGCIRISRGRLHVSLKDFSPGNKASGHSI